MRSIIELEIKNLKSIKDFQIALPFEKGLYAITGENGIGKSTIFAALSRLVYQGALRNFFRYDGDDSTIVRFRHNSLTNTWIRKLNWQRNDSDPEIKLEGTFEASLIFGSRFADVHKSKIGKGNYVTGYDLVDAAPFVRENLGNILRNDPNFYNKLKRIKSKALANSYGFDGVPYFLEQDEKKGKWLPQFFMSSGELLLIGLLDFINKRIIYKERNAPYKDNKKSLVLIDEIEFALHPSAQERLAGFLTDVSSDYDFCIYFATHSLQIINNIEPSKIFHIQSNVAGSLDVVNPCYPAYATRSLYSNDGFDYLLLVEDDLAKYVIEKIIIESNLDRSKLIKILPCGGWEQTLQMHLEFRDSRIAGKSCKIFSILDGDVKIECEQRYSNGTKYHSLPKNFLPIQSVEKYLRKNLVDAPEPEFAKKLGDRFYAYKSLDDILREYRNEPVSLTDKSGKKLFDRLQKYAEEQGKTRELYRNQLCSFIYEADDFSALKSSLTRIINSGT